MSLKMKLGKNIHFLGQNLYFCKNFHLSNDPGKTGSNFFFFFLHLRFPYIFSFSHRECKKKKKLQIGSLRNKMYFKSIFKECFFAVKRFQPIIRVANNGQEKFTILCVPHVDFCVT